LQRSQGKAGFNRRERREEQKTSTTDIKEKGIATLDAPCCERYCLSFAEADGFNYLDYNDASEQMARYFEEGFLAWIRLFCR
jgi:hypothetical protein